MISTFNYFFIISSIVLEENIENTYNGSEDVSSELKSSKTWDLTGTPIDIDDLTGLDDWDTINSTYDWCNGAGTLSDPYIIENVTIDGLNAGDCISIKNSDVYFIIRNCRLYNCKMNYAAIRFENVKKGLIYENNCSFNNGIGIIILQSENNTIFNNTLIKNYRGILITEGSCENDIVKNFVSNTTADGIRMLTNSNRNNISNNEVKYSKNDGIDVSESIDTIISNNIIWNSTVNGIILYDDKDVTISGNTVICNMHGIRLVYCENVDVVKNNASYNNEHGIYLEESDDNKVSENIISNNGIGIFLEDSNQNDVIKNTLIDNDKCIKEDDCEGNIIKDNSCGNTYEEEPDDVNKGSIASFNIYIIVFSLSIITLFLLKKTKLN